MTYRTFKKFLFTPVLVPVCMTILLAGMAIGETYNLRVGKKVIPARAFNNAKPIVMWGYAQCYGATPFALHSSVFVNCSSVQVPGPTLTATAGSALTINVLNSLNTEKYQEPTSLIIPGQTKPMTPVWMIPPRKPQGPSWQGAPTATGSRPVPGATLNDPVTDQNLSAFQYRVRSFDAETPADSATVTTYTWPAVKEGTYLYQSGTHPAVQVQMGLYGPLIVYPGAGQVFGTPGSVYAAPASPGGNAARAAVSYNTEAVLLYSEIDPALHDAIATGHYGPNPPLINPPANWMTSTANYTPEFYLINGKPYSPDSPGIPAGNLGQTVLLRFLNAGLRSIAPTIADTFNIIQTPALPAPYNTITPANLPYMTLIAEDGYPAPWLKQQYSLLLPAGKTMDAVIATTSTVGTTTSPGATIAIYDRRANLSNGPLVPGGQIAYLNVGSVPAISVSPTVPDFEGSTQLYHSRQLIVTIKNNGLQPLLVTNAAPTCPPGAADCDATAFSTNISAALAAIPPGKSSQITVYFKPTIRGEHPAKLQITSNDPNQGSIDIPLIGEGI